MTSTEAIILNGIVQHSFDQKSRKQLYETVEQQFLWWRPRNRQPDC